MPDMKIPPHNLEAEESVLGALLIDHEALVRVAEVLEPQHFYDERNSQIYLAMIELYKDLSPIDIVTVTNGLKKLGSFKKIGGSARLAELATRVPTSAHVEEYAKIIKNHAIKRALIALAGELSELSFSEQIETSTVLDTAEQKIFSISQKHLERSFVPLKKTLAESLV